MNRLIVSCELEVDVYYSSKLHACERVRRISIRDKM